MITSLREWLYKRKFVKSIDLPSCVVSVGNISMGGTGKSPFVAFLADWAVKRNLRAAVISRGYKRKSQSLSITRAGEATPNVDQIGDEPWMIHHKVPGATLLVHPDRARMAHRHWQDLEQPQLIIMDDGFQHWKARRDFDVVMIDATESIDQKSIPFGRLREDASALRRADLVVITRASAISREKLELLVDKVRKVSLPRYQPSWKRQTLPVLQVICADYEFAGYANAVTGGECEIPKDRELILVTGVAKPDSVRATVKELGLKVVEEIHFPDHHRLTSADKEKLVRSLSVLRNGALLITEKDWARWREAFQDGLDGFVLKVKWKFQGNGPEIADDFLKEVQQQIQRCSI